MADHGTHSDLHSDQGARSGEHPGRDRAPVIKVVDVAWAEFEKPDLGRAETFARAFGFVPAESGASRAGANEVRWRGSEAGAACLVLRRGRRNRFAGLAFRAAGPDDLTRLAARTGATVTPLPDHLGGRQVTLRDPSGLLVRIVAGIEELPALPGQHPRALNVAGAEARLNATQRPRREPARVMRLGHVVLQSSRFRETLDWYLHHLGLIVSDFLYYPGQRERGPTMAFVRCDQGSVPADHHTIALMLGPRNRYVHSAYQVADLDAMAAGGEYLKDQGYQRSWGIGRHIQGSQIFDYWRDPDGLLVEHFSDGDLFDNTLEPGWAPMTASGLAQWGPPATSDFLGVRPGTERLRDALATLPALRENNELDVQRLMGLLKVAHS